MIAPTNVTAITKGLPSKTASLADSPFLSEIYPTRASHVGEIIRIRPYRPSDREAVCRLCCETGFLGKPVDNLFQDRELFADLFTKPYLDHEPDWVLLAEVDGQVVGYLLGSVCRNFDMIQLRSGFRTSTRMLWRLITGKYSQHPRTRKFVRWLFSSAFFEQPKHPRNAAHLHFDLDRRYHGLGLVQRLWDIYEQRLRSAGITRCYGNFFSHPRRRPEAAYARYGFRVFDRRRTTLFQPEMKEPVDVVCVWKNL